MAKLKAEKIFEKLANKFDTTVSTEMVVSYAGNFPVKKFYLIEKEDVISKENINKIREANKLLPNRIESIVCPITTFIYKNGQIHINVARELKLFYNSETLMSPLKNYPDLTYEEMISEPTSSIYKLSIGDNGKLWIHNTKPNELLKPPGSKGDKRTVRSWPATLKDITRARKSVSAISNIIEALLEIWAEYSYCWKQVYEDIQKEEFWLPINTSEIFDCSSKYELILKHYGSAEKEAMDNSIFQSAFYERSKMLVTKENLPLLKGYNPLQSKNLRIMCEDKITNNRNIMSKYLGLYMYDNMCSKYKPTYDGAAIYPTDIEIAINQAIEHRDKIPIDLETPQEIMKWISKVWFRAQKQWLPVIKIPAESPFRNLKIPNGKKITTRQALIDESYRQNCEVYRGYGISAHDINNGKLMFWSIDEGEKHYTLIVGLNKKKTKFVLKGFFERKFKEANPQMMQLMENYLATQVPYRNPQKKQVN